MSVLYVCELNARLEKTGNRIIVKKGEEQLNSVPMEKVESIVLMGTVHITTPLTMELLEREIPVTWLSSTGKFFGRLEPTTGVNVERQREQFRRGDDEAFSLELAKSIITAKIKNSCVVLKRLNRERNLDTIDTAVKEIRESTEGVERAGNIEQLLGMEGNASKKYFRALALMVAKGFEFNKRTRQPPTDPFNSLLSFGYTLLFYELYTAVVSKGLHPYMGFLHKVKYGHPALVSDIIEEWRAIIVDSLVMKLVNNEIIQTQDFEVPVGEGGGVFLKRLMAKEFIKHFESRLRNTGKYLSYIDYGVNFRESFIFQAGSLAKAIEEKDPTIYRPVIMR